MGWVSGEHASFLALGFFKEEDPSLVPGKRQKRNKIAIFRMRRNKVREEDENDKEDEEDQAGCSPRVRRKQHAYSKTRQPKQKENSGISESNLNTTVSNTKSSPWQSPNCPGPPSHPPALRPEGWIAHGQASVPDSSNSGEDC